VQGAEGTPNAVEFAFDELSDGQRVIIGLHTIAAWLRSSTGVMILDEPDNFVSLAEIQPLIRGLLDTDRVQLIVASHHPEILNEMAVPFGIRLWRDRNGPVRHEKFKPPEGTLLTPAELVAARMDAPGE
jgi:ATPase subunit of ABC transporter with duplicated ATPase domains